MLGAVEPVLVPTPAGPVAVHVLGAGRPALLWHDVLADGSSWGYALPGLLRGRRLLVVDGPGWGRSRAARADADQVAVAAAVIERLAPGAPVDWLGNGWGGRVGLATAAARPGLVRSLVMAAADPRPMAVEQRRRLRPVVRGLRLLGPVGPIGRALVADRLSPGSRTEPQTVGAVLDALLLAGRSNAARAVRRADVRRPDLTGLLGGTAAPMLLLAGGADPSWTAEDAARAAALAPFARAAVVEGASRLVPLDRPAELTAAVRAFWASLGAD